MTRRERLMATLRGEPVDRPAVCFYEINGLDENPANPEPFNIYSHPSWAPAIRLAREKSDRIVMRGVPFRNAPPDPLAGLRTDETHTEGGSTITPTTIRAGRRTFTTRARRDPDVNTVWTLEHLLKDADDLKAWLELPPGRVRRRARHLRRAGRREGPRRHRHHTDRHGGPAPLGGAALRDGAVHGGRPHRAEALHGGPRTRRLREGTEGAGRGFVLMPSACPYGRVLSERALRNYETMIEFAERA